MTRCTSISNMTRRRRRWRGGFGGSSQKNRYDDDGGQNHQRRRELCLPQAEKDAGVGPDEAEEEPSGSVDREVDQSERAVRQPGLEASVEGQHGAEDEQAQQHLVGDLRVDDLARLA